MISIVSMISLYWGECARRRKIFKKKYKSKNYNILQESLKFSRKSYRTIFESLSDPRACNMTINGRVVNKKFLIFKGFRVFASFRYFFIEYLLVLRSYLVLYLDTQILIRSGLLWKRGKSPDFGCSWCFPTLIELVV